MNVQDKIENGFRQMIPYLRTRQHLKHLFFKIPGANQELSVRLLKELIRFTEHFSEYCFICGDEAYCRPGEIGIELAPGVKWEDLSL